MIEFLLAILLGLALAAANAPVMSIIIVLMFGVVLGAAVLATSGWSRRR